MFFKTLNNLINCTHYNHDHIKFDVRDSPREENKMLHVMVLLFISCFVPKEFLKAHVAPNDFLTLTRNATV